MNIYFIQVPTWYYDCVKSFVIIARNESEVRNIASSNCGDEGKAAWLSQSESMVQCIGTAASTINEPKMVVREFEAG